jgi:hypothetical protein
MTTGHDYPPDELPSDEATKRRDEALKRALAMPHKPHQESKLGRTRKPAPSRSRKKAD